MSRVIVSASDDNYLPLAKGMWLSLRDAACDLAFVDLGHADRTKDWLADNVPRVNIVDVPPAVERWMTELERSQYQRALLIRPFLPECLPGWDTILWLDADSWVQELDSVQLVFHVAEDRPDCAVVTPVLDLAYYPLFDFPAMFIDDNVRPVYDVFYGPEISADLSQRPILATALFAMRRDNPMWCGWAKELERLFGHPGDVADNVFHVAEQMAFNFLAYSSGKYVALSARHSFVASLGPLTRDHDGIVVVHEPERRRVGVVQLNGITEGHTPRYLEKGLFFDRGAYLTPEDTRQLLALRRS